MPETWSESVTRRLLDRSRCPRCGAILTGPVCLSCGVDLSGQGAWDILTASEEAAAALRRRQQLVDALPVVTSRLATAPAATPVAAAPAVPTRASSQLSLQSVLAVAGAGLVAVAAIVFTFFNPDLTNFTTRTVIIAAITAVFLGAAWLLARRGLQLSAEAVGALGTVFVGLDVWAFTEASDDPSIAFVLAAIGTIVSAGALVVLGTLVRIRAWVWVGFAALPLVPVFLGLAFESEWMRVVGFVGAFAVALAVHPLLGRVGSRLASPMRTDHVTALVLQLAAGLVALIALWGVPGPLAEKALGSAGVLLALSVLAGASARHGAARWWSWSAGALLAAAGGVAPLALDAPDVWPLALAGAGVTVAAAATFLVRARGSMVPGLVRSGVWWIALLVALPAVALAVPQLAARAVDAELQSLGPDPLDALAVVAALAAGSVASLILDQISRRTPARESHDRVYAPSALWLGMLALASLVTWAVFPVTLQVILSLIVAAAIGLGVALIRRLRAMRGALRAPLLAGAHALLILAALMSWPDPSTRVLLGAAGVATVMAIALAMPVVARPFYTAVGYSYALLIVSAAFTLTGFDTIAVLCLTTSVAAVAAIVATVTPWLGVRHWYAVLLVTAVPFAIGVVSVLIVRSGWTGLSTAVTFALLLVIVLTRRAGLTRRVRTGAAALLVPALAVVVICLGAEWLAVSASPVTLPVIAVIVACTLSATGLIGAGLVRRGIPEADARWARIAIEISTLVTGVIAVVLALVRAAAGIPTTLVVLLILGVGAVATALLARRRYGWPLAGASLTGALWCVWALNGVTGLEPYLLPPTLGAALVGAVLVARGLPGLGLSASGLYATGLATAIVPVLVAQAALGADPLPLRAWGLLGGSTALVLFGAFIPRLVGWAPLARLGALRTPSLVIAVVAAIAGVIQAVRYGLELDPLVFRSDELVIVPVIVYSAGAALLAAVAGALLAHTAGAEWAAPARLARSRWLFVPAVLFLAVGPIVGMRAGWLPILSVYVISLLLLALMIVTAVRARTRDVVLPPVFFTFAVAWSVAVASWSARDLRVEAYSLPLGMSLLAVGVIAMWPQREVRGTLASWPMGFSGSWRLLAPGILVTLVPSVLATGTDPRTERAILVIALALVAILIGNLRRLAAPFILGIIVLPVENIVVFAVQIGRNIGALPWWITLATAGAVLLVLAVTSERRVGKGQGAAARIRDLT